VQLVFHDLKPGADPATDYLDGDEVQFDDTATGSTVVDLGSFVSPTNTTFNNSTKNYTLNSASGFGILTNSLTKSGTGSATINTFNSYTGGTTFTGGTLNLGNAGALGNGSFTVSAGTAKTLDNTTGGSLTMSTVTSQTWNDDFTFAGSNDLDMGTGAVTLSGTSRTVTVNAGRLTVGGLNGGTTTALVVNGAGTLAIGNSTVTGLSGNGNIANNATAAATLTVNMSSNFTYSGVLSDGSGNTLALTKQGDGVLKLTNASTYTGNTSIQGGTVVMSNGQALGAVTSANTVRFSNAAPSTSATLDIATNGVGDNVYRIMVGTGALVNIVSDRATPGPGIDHALTTGGDSATDTLGGGTINFVKGANVTSGTASVSFDQLNMSGSTAGSSTILNPTTARVTIGTVTKNRNAPTQILELSGTNTGNQITGSISNGSTTSVSLTKSGTSTWTLSGDSSYTGATTVNGGTLLVNGNNSGATGAVTVGAAGILGGTGTIGSTVTMQAGSTFTAQFSGGTIDPLDIVGDLDLSAINNLLTVVGSGTSGPWTIINYSGTLTGTFESSPSYTVNYGTGSNSAITISFAGLLGDFNSDGKVDAGDYVKWRKNDGLNAALPNDGGASTQAARFSLWRANFGKPPGSGSGLAGANVPKPATWLLVSMAVAALTAAARRRTVLRIGT
jgi:fibronectin-binding autotransporter adhesin